jgi:rubrerythrin
MSLCIVSTENETTVKNLLAAFERDLNAYSNYSAFAVQADLEGWFEAGSLLRTIGRSEKIHADNHAHVIRQLGGEPRATMHPAEVRTTSDNLTAALEEEVYGIDSVYPYFLVENRSANNSAARTLAWALEAKKAHARLLSELITQMQRGSEKSSMGAATEFYVRPVCGYVSQTAEPERCWVCEHFCKTFEVVR